MKSSINKPVFLLVVCLFASASAFSQETDHYPYWTISKDVQRIRFSRVEFEPVVIRTGNLPLTVSKGVQLINIHQSPTVIRQVRFTGTPARVISKGVARMQVERKSKSRK